MYFSVGSCGIAAHPVSVRTAAERARCNQGPFTNFHLDSLSPEYSTRESTAVKYSVENANSCGSYNFGSDLLASSIKACITDPNLDSTAVILLIFTLLEWRNWQTHGTQNPAGFTSHVGSTPTSSTSVHQLLSLS